MILTFKQHYPQLFLQKFYESKTTYSFDLDASTFSKKNQYYSKI